MFRDFIYKVHKKPIIILSLSFFLLFFINIMAVILSHTEPQLFGSASMFFSFDWYVNFYPYLTIIAILPDTPKFWLYDYLPNAIISSIFGILSLLSFGLLLVLLLKKKKAYYFSSLPFALAVLANAVLGDIAFIDISLPYFIINLLLLIISVAYTVLVAYNEKQVENLKNYQK